MEYTNKRRQVNSLKSNSEEATKAPSSTNQAYLQAVLAGKARANAETMGHRQDLAPSINAKMSKAFGMDLSQLQLYRSNAMEGTDTQGMASGNKIVLSKDIDLNTMAGQAILGHEISHVRAQSQGIGMGHTGLYNNASLEHQADTEGMMAARGQSILGESSGIDMGLGMGGISGLTPLSAGMSASAGAPMQASGKRKKKKPDSKANSKLKAEIDNLSTPEIMAPAKKNAFYKKKSKIESIPWKADANDESFKEYKKHADNGHQGFNHYMQSGLSASFDTEKYMNTLTEMYGNNNIDKLLPGAVSGGESLRRRIAPELYSNSFYGSVADEDKKQILDDLHTKNDKGAILKLKKIYFQHLKEMESKYGRMLEQMNVNDIIERSGKKGFGADFAGTTQIEDLFTSKSMAGETENILGKEDDEKFSNLMKYYGVYKEMLSNIASYKQANLNEMIPQTIIEAKEKMKGLGSGIQGPMMNAKELKAYNKMSKKKYGDVEDLLY